MNIEVNYLAVLVAAIISMAIGFFWYGSKVFRIDTCFQLVSIMGMGFVIAVLT